MDHPTSRMLARYALGEITDEKELSDLEEHLLVCDSCQRRAVAVDLIGTEPESDDLLLHIAADQDGGPAALCGEDGSRNTISAMLLPGMNPSLVCRKCMALVQAGSGESSYVN